MAEIRCEGCVGPQSDECRASIQLGAMLLSSMREGLRESALGVVLEGKTAIGCTLESPALESKILLAASRTVSDARVPVGSR